MARSLGRCREALREAITVPKEDLRREPGARAAGLSSLGLTDQVVALGVKFLACHESCLPHFLLLTEPFPCHPEAEHSLTCVHLPQSPTQAVVWFLGSTTHDQSWPTTNQGHPHPVSW